MRFLTIVESIGEGIVSVPETLYDGVIRTGQGWAFWNTEEEIKIAQQNGSAYQALKQVLRHGFKGAKSPITLAVAIIIKNYYDSLPETERSKIVDAAIKKGIFITAKMTTSYLLSQYVADKVAKKIVATAAMQKLFRFTTSAEFSLLAMQGLLYKAGAASDRLKKQYPKIYNQLRAKNLDMIYFLIEDPMKKYLNVVRLVRIFGAAS